MACHRGEQSDASSERSGAIRGEMLCVFWRWLVDKPAINLWKTSLSSFYSLPFSFRKSQRHQGFKQRRVSFKSISIHWNCCSSTQLEPSMKNSFADLNVIKELQSSHKLTILAQNLPHLGFPSIFNTTVSPEKSQKHCVDVPELHMQRHPNAHPALCSHSAIKWPRHYFWNVGL